MYCAGSRLRDRTVYSTSRCLQSGVFRTRPTTSSRMSVQTMSGSSSCTSVTAIRRWMPWCSRNVPAPGTPSEWSTLHVVYLSINHAPVNCTPVNHTPVNQSTCQSHTCQSHTCQSINLPITHLSIAHLSINQPVNYTPVSQSHTYQSNNLSIKHLQITHLWIAHMSITFRFTFRFYNCLFHFSFSYQ